MNIQLIIQKMHLLDFPPDCIRSIAKQLSHADRFRFASTCRWINEILALTYQHVTIANKLYTCEECTNMSCVPYSCKTPDTCYITNVYTIHAYVIVDADANVDANANTTVIPSWYNTMYDHNQIYYNIKTIFELTVDESEIAEYLWCETSMIKLTSSTSMSCHTKLLNISTQARSTCNNITADTLLITDIRMTNSIDVIPHMAKFICDTYRRMLPKKIIVKGGIVNGNANPNIIALEQQLCEITRLYGSNLVIEMDLKLTACFERIPSLHSLNSMNLLQYTGNDRGLPHVTI
jgi:hypothetical protein